MEAPVRFNLLVVDSDSVSRLNLKQAALALSEFDRVEVVSTTHEAMQRTSGFPAFDLCILSHRLASKSVGEFLKAARETDGSQDWAFMMLVKPDAKQSENIAEKVMEGVDGFLLEPYSADNLREIAKITARVKHEKLSRKKKIAMRVLLSEVSAHLDMVSLRRKRGEYEGISVKRLQELRQHLQKFQREDFDIYIEAVAEELGKAEPFPTLDYGGPSERVRKLKEKELERMIEERLKQSGSNH